MDRWLFHITFAAMASAFSAYAADAPLAADVPGLEPIPRAAQPETADPVAATMAYVSTAFDLPLPANERMQLAVTRLAALVHSKSATDRQGAAFTNGMMAGMFEQRVALQTLRTLLADPEPKVRSEAVYSCIGCSGLWAIALPALPQITSLYSDPDPEVRRAARFVSTKLRSLNAKKLK